MMDERSYLISIKLLVTGSRESGTRIKDWPVDLQRKRFKSLTGHEPTDGELEMALDLNLM